MPKLVRLFTNRVVCKSFYNRRRAYDDSSGDSATTLHQRYLHINLDMSNMDNSLLVRQKLLTNMIKMGKMNES